MVKRIIGYGKRTKLYQRRTKLFKFRPTVTVREHINPKGKTTSLRVIAGTTRKGVKWGLGRTTAEAKLNAKQASHRGSRVVGPGGRHLTTMQLRAIFAQNPSW